MSHLTQRRPLAAFKKPSPMVLTGGLTHQHQQPVIDPRVAAHEDFQRAQRLYCRPGDPLCLGIKQSRVELLVFDFDDTVAKLYAPVARLNLKYLKTIARQNKVPLHQAAQRATTLALHNPDAVVHDPHQMVRAVFGPKIAGDQGTQTLLRQWQEDKRDAFRQGIDRSFLFTAKHFRQGGTRIAFLSNSPATPLRERLSLLDEALRAQGASLLPLIDVIACKPDPAGLTPRPPIAMQLAERAFQAALDKSDRLIVLPARASKDQGIGIIKSHLEQTQRLRAGIQHIVQVGDRMSDLRTAHLAGAQAVWITGNLLEGGDKAAMRYVGEAKVADTMADAMQTMMARPARKAEKGLSQPHAVIGTIGYLRHIFRPAAPR